MTKGRIFLLSILVLFFYNCEDDNTSPLDLIYSSVEDLHAPQQGGQGQPIAGEFAKFDFDDMVYA